MVTSADVAREIREQLDAMADDATRRKYERRVPGARVVGGSG